MKSELFKNLILFPCSAGVAVVLMGCASSASVDSPSEEILVKMSETLAAADRFEMVAERYLDEQLVSNPAVIGKGQITTRVSRPDRAKVVIKGEGKERRLYIGPDISAIHSPHHNAYAWFSGGATIEESCDAASEHLGILVPGQDFLSGKPYNEFRSSSREVVCLGESAVGDEMCHHLRGSRDDLEWELWVSKSTSLPQQLYITKSGIPGKHHLRITVSKWDLTPSFSASDLKFSPPEGADEIDIVIPAE